MKTEKENPSYLPKVAYVRLHTAGKTAKDYQQELKGQGFTFKQFRHMAKSDEYFDGIELWVSMWSYDNHESWHLWNWKKEDDNRVMMAMYEAEQFNPYAQYINDFEGFKADWEAGTYDPGCTFTFPLEAVEVIEVVQEEKDNTDHEKVRKTVAAEKEAVFLQRRKAWAAKKHRKKKRKGNRGAAGMGKKHCRNKWEVLKRVQQRQETGKPKTVLENRLRTINQIRSAMEKAGKQMREGTDA